MIHRVMGSVLHWRIGNRVHFGFHRYGNCWRLFSLPYRERYFSGRVTFYGWWRLFVSLDAR